MECQGNFGGRVRRCCKNKEYVVGFLNCCGIVILLLILDMLEKYLIMTQIN